MFLPVTRNVYRWETPDPEHGEMMVGHLLKDDTGYTLIDPPMVPNLAGALSVLGQCKGVIITSISHARGSATLSTVTGANYFVPRHQESLYKGDKSAKNLVFYDGETVLPMGIKAGRCRSDRPIFNNFHIDEMVIFSREGAFVGDSAHGLQSSRVVFAPEDIVPEPDIEAVKSSLAALDSILKGNSETVFFGHGFDQVGSFNHNMNQRKKELGVE